jgi:hypothetical protein
VVIWGRRVSRVLNLILAQVVWQVYRVSSLCPQTVIGPKYIIISEGDHLEILLLALINQKKLLGLGDTIRTLADGGVLGATQNFSLDFPPTPCLGSVDIDFNGVNQLGRVLLLRSVCAQPVADLIQHIPDVEDLGIAFTFLQLLNH